MTPAIEEAAIRAYGAHLTTRVDEETVRRWWGQLFDSERVYWRNIARSVLSHNYLMVKALRDYANSIHFTCTLCGKKHVSPGVGENGVALFPSETLETMKDKGQKHFIQCKECPPPPKAKSPKAG